MRSSSPKLFKMLNKKNIPLIIAGLIVLVFVIILINKFVFNKNIQLKRAVSGNINVLILGRGGGVHDGPDLTDTLIFAMFNPNKKTADLISIPRDLWVPQIKGRVNLAYAQGEKNNGQGLLLSKAALERVLGQKIDYVVVIDFSGFVKLIDHLGGIDVDVARVLDDYRYPIEGKEQELCGHPEEEVKEFVATGPAELELWDYFDCRYKHIHVDSGMQHMDGQQALEFSRSRHGVGAEGSDFARSRRQQEVITAVRNKILSLGIILNPVKVLGIYNILSDNIDTNIKTEEIDDFINLARNMQESQIQSYVLDFGNQADGRDGLLKEALPEASKGYSYNLIPRVGDGNFAEIHDYVGCIAGGHICEISDEGIIKDPISPTKKK